MGDCTNDIKDAIGIYHNRLFFLRNSNTNGVAEIAFDLGIRGNQPRTGNWERLP